MEEKGIRVEPPFVEFKDMKVGEVYKKTVSITNVGKVSRKVTVEKPSLKIFKLTRLCQPWFLPSGFCIRGTLEFTPDFDFEEIKDSFHIFIDDKEIFEVPITGLPRYPSLTMDSLVDFGCLLASNKVIRKLHPITNKGSAPGRFYVKYEKSEWFSLNFLPRHGIVQSGTTVWLTVELYADIPGRIAEEALVKLPDCSVLLSVKAEIVEQHLEVSDMQGSPISCLWFGPVYFGASSEQKVVLKNNAPISCDWICLLMDKAAGVEAGADLQASTVTTLLERMKNCGSPMRSAFWVLECMPSQGRLQPNQTITVVVRFSPKSRRRWRSTSPRRQDYCLFLLFDIVSCKHGFTQPTVDSSVEVAVTGSGIPVALVPSPSDTFDFSHCALGQRSDLLCVLQNLCPQLPVRFRFRKLAHFTAQPPAGTIPPGQCQDVVLTFNARQQGIFQVRQKVDILGWVASQENGCSTEVRCFHTILLHLSAICDSMKKPPQPKLHSALKCPAGLRPCVRLKELDPCSTLARIATAKLHKHRREMSPITDIDEFLAFPNDRPTSVRPASPHSQYRTIFTGVRRHHYIDPAYAFTREDYELRQRNRQTYINFIRQRWHEKTGERQPQTGNDSILQVDTHNGLVPPDFNIRDLNSSKSSDMSSRLSIEITSNGDSQIFDTVNTVPSTWEQVEECQRTLTPLELYQVDITPMCVNFGTVALHSACATNVHLVNRLPVHVWVELAVDCDELQGSSMLSQVLPPFFHSIFPLTFQSMLLGGFRRSLRYTINQQHPGQIQVQAEVVPLVLELSSNLLVLTPNPMLLLGSEYRGIVTLRNLSNCVAEFVWKAVLPESGLLLYSIQPSAGVVEAYMEIVCEINWFPGFNSPTEGDFDLFVQEGSPQRLHCIAKVGSTTVELAEKRILFTSVPLNTVSVRSAVLHNSGQNHAYFKVVNICPLPGMLVSPTMGAVPSRGQTLIRIQFNPDCVFKFDTKIEIALKNMKSIKLRVAGSVEPPDVTFSKFYFQFCGVHIGSQQSIPFSVTNHSVALSQVTFDLSKYKDFSVKAQLPSTKKELGVTVVEVGGGQTEECLLVFSPTQVTAYNFALPITVNGVKWPSSLPSFYTSSSSTTLLMTPDSRKTVTTSTSSFTDEQQSLWVDATALFAPVEMSSTHLQFVVVSHFPTFPQIVELKAKDEESICWKAVPGGVRWRFDLGAAEELCAVAPAFGLLKPGQSVCLAVTINPEATRNGERITKVSIPMYLGGEEEEGRQRSEEQNPYRELSVVILLSRPSIIFFPHQILLTPVPLSKEMKTVLTLHTTGYPSGTTITAECEEVEARDGTKIQPISVNFPQGNLVYAQNISEQGTKTISLQCEVSFFSNVPVSLCTTITFSDHMKNKFKIKVCGVAENCLLTVWPYLAIHHTDQHVVVQAGASSVEALLLNYNTPSPSTGPITSSSSSSSSSSSFELNSSGCYTSDSLSYSRSPEEQPRKNKITATKSVAPAIQSIPKFPPAKSEESKFYQKVLQTVEKWFSFHGWPSGTNPKCIPHCFRRVVHPVQTSNSNKRTFSVTQNRDTRSVVDMLEHLTGRRIPGIPMCQTFSKDIHQRTTQLLQQNEAMLEFLRVQGACLCHIKPEYLLDVAEFKHWCSLQEKEPEKNSNCNFLDFWSLSKRSWTDVLLQIYKVLVLSHVPEDTLHEPLYPRDTEDALLDGSHPLTSNVYSLRELHLLSWLNLNYQKMRKVVWEGGRVPPSRWIVNFDLDFADGLVLGALIAAHCPYLIRSHFQRMYTTPSALPQIFHNSIIVTQALILLGLSLNLKSSELCEINPVQSLFLCVHLYETLPHYMPSETLTLSGCLHSTLNKKVRLKNHSSRPLRYKVLLLGEDAHLFSVPGSSIVTVPPESDAELTVQFRCCFLRPVEAVLLLITRSAFGLRCATLAFNLKTRVTQITLTNSVQFTSPCYQLKVINMPLTNNFDKKASFRVVLVQSSFNPLGPEKKKDRLSLLMSPDDSEEKDATSDTIGGDQFEDGEANEFLSTERCVYLKPGQPGNLRILFMPFFIGTKYCSVLLLSPEVGDMVHVVKATSEIPLPSPLPARPTLIPGKSDTGGSFLSFQCKVGEVFEEVLQVPLVNKSLEDALAVWAQQCMNAEERGRRILTRSLHSTTMRTAAATQKLLGCSLIESIYYSEELRYKVEVSLPHFFDLPKTVTIPVKEGINVPWDASTACGGVDIPLRFQAHSVGELTCNVVLTSCFDTRVYQLKASVTQRENATHLDFSSPALQSVTQHIPLLNETLQNWSVQAEVCGEGFSGPDVVDVPAGTKQTYPLTVLPTSQCIATGRLCLHNDFDGTEHVFTLRRVGEPPLPLDHIVLSCPVGKTTYAELDIPNYTQKTLTLRAVTDLPILSGSPSLEINPGQGSPYTLAVSPWKRGEYTGSISFIEHGDTDERENNKGNSIGNYIVIFSLVVNCEPEAPKKVIDVQCVAESSVAIEIPVSNPGEELLTLDVCLEGGDLTGANRISLPPRGTLSYKVSYSPVSVGKGTGSVVFQSELMGEFWYQLELYALPPSVVTLPQAHCHLGKWVRINIPLVNPTAETLELIVANSNPRHYSLEMDSAETITLAPKSCTNVGVRFSPSSIGEENHHGKISFTCSQLQDCCVLLSGCGLRPEIEEPLCMSCLIGSSTSISVPILNPTDHQATLNITLTADDPNDASNCKLIDDEKTFSCTLDNAEVLQISERATVGVPIVFTPKTTELQKAWLCVTMKPISGQDSTGSSEELLHISWLYPLRGIPVEAPIESSPHAVLQCEVGGQLESTVDVQLTGYVPGNRELRGQQGLMDDLLCKVQSDSETARSRLASCLSISIQAARRDPESGAIMLTLRLIYTPRKIRRFSSVLAVQSSSGKVWEFPLVLIATKPQVDDVVRVETTEIGRTSAVGFRLTSTTRRSTAFKATFLPGSSTEFTVAPASGMLPPAGTAGALISVFFTPTASCKRHRARLVIQAADMQWIYDVRGKTTQDHQLLRKSSTKDSLPAPHPPRERQRNFVVQNLRIPFLANSSPLKVKK
ncbi:cilia- and flagella-associated protein 47-like [Poeciliopsis prolifica]|uniref:cilia- and flagella-associated protein 47-like n=1 Tax=Poeciliopsis prolifica TaxID=188132 RepID=UPI0024145B4F|nr:cilia- and flagella-associated protein 47-like [Poeciliopsis prolifica]XP_054915149.1 cilia- and flagella-associated protein 47-like [Poeciliopsis prolifica]